MPIIYHVPLISFLILMMTGVISLLIQKNTNLRKISYLAIASVFVLNLALVIYFHNTGLEYFKYSLGAFPAPWGNEIKATPIEPILVTLVSGVTGLALRAGTYMRRESISKKRRNTYHTNNLLALGSLVALIYVNDVFTSYVFLEINTIAACALMVAKMDGLSIRATLKYYVMSSLGSGMFLLGTAHLYGLTGQLAMEPMRDALQNVVKVGVYNNSITIALIIMIVGISLKSGLFPFHTWSPDAYSNATPSTSAFLSGVISKGYVFLSMKLIYRVFTVEILKQLGVFPVIIILGVAGMMIGSIFALMQTGARRMTAYSSVAQIGYLFTAMGLGTPIGLAAAAFHIINHCITKAALFLTVGSATSALGTEKIDKMDGVGYLMPVTMTMFSIAALSMVGIPPLIGFTSKWYFVEAMVQSNAKWALALMSISSLLNAGYWFPIIYRAFFSPKAQVVKNEENIGSLERPFSDLWPVMILVALIIILGVVGASIYQLILTGAMNF